MHNINLYNMDCMEFLASCKDKQFDLAIVDPPYGLGKRTTDGGSKLNTQTKIMVNSKGEIKAKEIIKGIEYQVIQTKKGSGNVWGARDTIRNNNTGQSKEMTRKEWYELFKKYT